MMMYFAFEHHDPALSEAVAHLRRVSGQRDCNWGAQLIAMELSAWSHNEWIWEETKDSPEALRLRREYFQRAYAIRKAVEGLPAPSPPNTSADVSEAKRRFTWRRRLKGEVADAA